MTSTLLALAFALTPIAAPPAARPTIAVLPLVPIESSESWLGLAVADNVATGLLRYSRRDPKGGVESFPINVFSWRESLGAARGDGINTSRPLAPEAVRKLARELGARYVFSGSYRIKPGKTPRVLLKWRLVDAESTRPAKDVNVTTNFATLSTRTDKLLATVLKGLGERPERNRTPTVGIPTKALKAYAKGLEVLARQSLEPHARVVLPAMDLKKARLLFEDATADAPEFLRAWVGLALTSAMLGELELAEKQMLRALARADDFEPLNALGLYYLYVRQNKPEQAIGTLTAAGTRNPGFMGALGYLGSAYLRTGQPSEAAEVFAAYEARVPKSPWARVMHARSLAYSGQHEAAIKKTAGVLAEHLDSVMVITALAARHGQAKAYPEAIKTLEAGLTLYPDHPALLTKLSYVQLQLNRPEVALALAERAIAKQGDSRGETMAGYAYANLGHALALLGRREAALDAFRKAAELGIDSEVREQLLADERAKAVLADPKNPIVADAPPPAAAASAASPAAVASASEPEATAGESEAGADEELGADESWSEEDDWSASDDWSEADYDEEPEVAPQPAAAPVKPGT